MSKKDTRSGSLFDVIEAETAKQEKEDATKDPSSCKHTKEVKTFTVWPGTTDERMTWTCVACGRYRGRC